MPEPLHVAALTTGIALATVSQLLFKHGALSTVSTTRSLVSRSTILGYALSFGVTICTVIALKAFDLKLVTAWTGATFALVVLLSWALLREPLRVRQLIGVLMIVGGIVVF